MNTRTQFLMFSVSGAIGLIVDLSALYLASIFMNLYSARLLSFLVAVTSTWLLNRNFTFKESEQKKQTEIKQKNYLLTEFLRYFVANLSGGLVNLAVYSLYISYNFETTEKYIATCLGSLSGLALNFSLSKFVVFRKKNNSQLG